MMAEFARQMSVDSLLTRVLREGRHPTGGGCLCLAGDCPHCLASVDGVAYVRTCQIPFEPSAHVEWHPPRGQYPPLESRGARAPMTARTIHCDVVVIGQGSAGRAAADEASETGAHVETLDSGDGQDAIGIYPGPLVVARTATGMLHLYPRGEIIVATGAAEIQPAVPGNQLRGLMTSRAASQLAAAGIQLGRVVAVGIPPEGIVCEEAEGSLVRFESASDGARVAAVVMRSDQGVERRYECDTVSLGLGF